MTHSGSPDVADDYIKIDIRVSNNYLDPYETILKTSNLQNYGWTTIPVYYIFTTNAAKYIELNLTHVTSKLIDETRWMLADVKFNLMRLQESYS